MVWSLLGLVPARRARSPGGEHRAGEPVHGRAQRPGNGVDAALPPPGGQLLGVVGGQGEAVRGEEGLQAAGQRAHRPAGPAGALDQRLRVSGLPVLVEQPAKGGDQLAGPGRRVGPGQVGDEPVQPVRRAGQPGRQARAGGEGPVRAALEAGRAHPQPRMPPDLPALRAFAGRVFLLAGPGARAAPAGRFPQIPGAAAPRAGPLGCGLPGLAPAVPAQGVLGAADRVPALAAAPGAQDAPAGLVLQDPLLPAARALRLRRGLADVPLAPAAVLAADDPDRGAAAGAVPLLLAHARLRPAAGTGRGPTPPSPAPAEASAGTAGCSTGVVSTSNRSLGVQSRAVHSAARVESFTWDGSLVNSADTDAADISRPAFSASSRRSWLPVHTSRCAAAIRSFHRMFTPAPPR